MAGLPLIKRTITGGMVVMIKYQNFTLDEQMNTFAEFWLGAHLAFILPAVRRRCIPGDYHDDGRDDYHDHDDDSDDVGDDNGLKAIIVTQGLTLC